MSLSLSHGRSLDPQQWGILQEQLPPLGESPEATRYDIRALWPADRRGLPFELEIGSGKGAFLVQQATQLPDVNYLGIEWAKQFWRYAAERARRAERHGSAVPPQPRALSGVERGAEGLETRTRAASPFRRPAGSPSRTPEACQQLLSAALPKCFMEGISSAVAWL